MTEDGLSLPHFQNNNCTVRDEASETEKQGGEGRKKESEGGSVVFFFCIRRANVLKEQNQLQSPGEERRGARATRSVEQNRFLPA